jgi:hypothetical protein
VIEVVARVQGSSKPLLLVASGIRSTIGAAIRSGVCNRLCDANQSGVSTSVGAAIRACSSPAISAAVLDTRYARRAAVSRAYGVGVHIALRATVSSTIGATVCSTIGSAIRTAIGSAVCTAVGSAVRTTIGTAVGSAVRATVGTAVGSAVRATVGATVLDALDSVGTAVRGAFQAVDPAWHRRCFAHRPSLRWVSHEAR